MQSPIKKQLAKKSVTWYWVPDTEKIWVVGEFVEEKNDVLKLTLRDSPSGTINVAKKLCVLITDPSIVTESVDDLISLSQVNDASILNCSRLRFMDKVIYTSIGAVLMAMNPFEVIPNLYGIAKINMYRTLSDENKPSHVYLIPSRAYSALCSFGINQSILISGESGAGKTEATKHCLGFLTTVAVDSSGSDDKNTTNIATRIVAASPILEAFGNAQTIRNPNSSRFGKWMELIFSRSNTIEGSRITSYLLEKSRVTQHDPSERNYHIFYQLLRGATDDLLRELSLSKNDASVNFNYLCQSHSHNPAKDLNDSEAFEEVMEAFRNMGFSTDAIRDVLRIVSAVLLLGNIEFNPIDQGEASIVHEADENGVRSINDASTLLGVTKFALSTALCTRTIQSGGFRKSITTVKLNCARARETRDSLARQLYNRIFLEIIVQINENNKAVSVDDGTGSYSGENAMRCIGLLDIFGFEIFEINSFEQLCINFCNEMLQNHFNFVIFISETKLYEEENIYCDTIQFKENSGIISSIEECFRLLDEEGKIPRGSSKTWFDKMKRASSSSSSSTKSMTFPAHKDSFVVIHYAGPVSYIPDAFMEKNTEVFSNDLLKVMSESDSKLVKKLFNADDSSQSGTMKPRQSSASAAVASVSKSFCGQLTSLMTMLKSTESHFIRCIKSNDKCRPAIFDAGLVQRQLLYSGVFEVVKIQQSGYPFRLKHETFENRYRCLVRSSSRWAIPTDDDNIVIRLQAEYPNELTNIRRGKTMTFMKGREFRLLENEKQATEYFMSEKLKHWMASRSVYRLHVAMRNEIISFKKAISDISIPNAEKSLEIIKDIVFRVSILSIVNPHLITLIKLTNELELVKKQQLIITTITSILDTSTPLNLELLERIEELTNEAKSINFSHPSVSKAESILKKVDIARKTIDNMKSNTQMSSSELESALDALSECKQFLEGVDDTISNVKTVLIKIKSEVDEYVPKMKNAFVAAALHVSKQSGMIDDVHVKDNLGEVLETIDVNALHSKECKVLYKCCELYIAVKQHVIQENLISLKQLLDDFKVVLASLQESDDVQSSHYLQIVKDNFSIVQNWLVERESVTSLINSLKIGNIKSTLSSKSMAETEELRATIDSGLSLSVSFSEYGSKLFSISQLVLKLRYAYNNRNWKEIDDILQTCSEDMINFLSLHSTDTLAEFDNCKWLVKYYFMLNALIRICSTSSFSIVNIENNDYSNLVSRANEYTEILKNAKSFRLTDEPVFAAAEDLASKIYMLQNSIYNRNLNEAESILKQIEGHPGIQQAPACMNEIEAAKAIVKLFCCENNLMEALGSHQAALQLKEENSKSKIAVNVPNEGILSLEKSIADINVLPRVPKSLLHLLSVIESKFLQGRKLVNFLSKNAGVTFSCYASDEHNHEWYDDTINKLQYSSTELLTKHNKLEYEIIEYNVKRRKFIAALKEIILTRCINGVVGGISIHRDIYYKLNKLFQHTLNEINDFIAIVSKSEIWINIGNKSVKELIDMFMIEVNQHIDVSKNILQLRQFTMSDDWNNIEKYFESVDGNASIKDNDELSLIYREMNHLKLIRNMEYSIVHLEVQLIPNTCNINASPDLIQHNLLSDVMNQAKVIGCHNKKSIKLIEIVSAIANMVELVKNGKAYDVNLQKMITVTSEIESIKLDSTLVVAVIRFVRTCQIVHKLYVAASSSTESRQLYVVILKAKSSCTSSPSSDAVIDSDMIRWIEIAEDLRYLRVLNNSNDWLGIREHSSLVMEKAANFDANSDEEKKFLSLIVNECQSSFNKGTDEYIDVQISIASESGQIGSKGSTNYCVPEMSIQVLKKMLNELESHENHMNSERKKKLKFLLTLRESIREEGAVMQSVTRSVTQSKDLAAGSGHTLPSEKSLSSSAIFSSTSLSPYLLEARHHTEESLQDPLFTTGFAHTECSLVARMRDLIELVENLENVALLPVIGWTDNHQVEFFINNSKLHLDAIQKISTSFPEAVDDIPLIKVISELHNLLSTAQSSQEYATLEKSLKTFLSLISITEIPSKVLTILQDQISIFQRGHLLDQLSTLASEGCHLLEVMCYNRQTFDEYLTKTTIVSKLVEHQVVPQDVMSCIRCVKCARELCWASELHMPGEFNKYRNQLNKEAEEVPAWFHEKLVKWLAGLSVPQMPDNEPHSRQKDLKNNSHLERGKFHETEAPQLILKLKGASDSISILAKYRESPILSQLQQTFSRWKDRVHMLNALWRGIFSLAEDWISYFRAESGQYFRVIPVHPLLASFSPIYHTDIYHLETILKIIDHATLTEKNISLRNLLSDMNRIFQDILAVVNPYATSNFTVPSNIYSQMYKIPVSENFSLSSKEEQVLFKKHNDLISNSSAYCGAIGNMLFSTNAMISDFYGKVISKRIGFRDGTDHYLLKSVIISALEVKFEVIEIMSGYFVHVVGHPEMLREICSGWRDNDVEGDIILVELLQALSQSPRSASKIAIKSKLSGDYYMVNSCVIQGKGTICLLNVSRSLSITIHCSTTMYYVMISKKKSLKLISIAVDMLLQSWSIVDPDTSALIQLILGETNVGNGYMSLQTVLKETGSAISSNIRTVQQKERLFVLSQSGYCLDNYSPWKLHWIDVDTIAYSLRFVNEECKATEKSAGKQEYLDVQHVIMSAQSIIDHIPACSLPAVIFDGFDINSEGKRFSISMGQNSDSDSENENEDTIAPIKSSYNTPLRRLPEFCDEKSESFGETSTSRKPSLMRRNTVTALPMAVPTEVNPISGWKIAHQLAQSVTNRISHSKGFLKVICEIVDDISATIYPRSHPLCSTNTEFFTQKINVAEKLRSLMSEGSAFAMHPAFDVVLTALYDIYCLCISLKSFQQNFKEVSCCLSSITQRIKSLFSDLSMHNSNASNGFANVVKSISLSFSKLLSTVEGVERYHNAMKSFRHMIRNDKEVNNPILIQSNKYENIQEYLHSQFTPFHSQDVISPHFNQEWLEVLERDEATIQNIISTRSFLLSQSNLLSNLSNITSHKPESNQLSDFSLESITISDYNIRVHLLKLVGVVSLRGAQLGVESKVQEICRIIYDSGCDMYHINSLLSKLTLATSNSKHDNATSKFSKSSLAAQQLNALTSVLQSLKRITSNVIQEVSLDNDEDLNRKMESLSPNTMKKELSLVLAQSNCIQTLCSPSITKDDIKTSPMRLLLSRIQFISQFKYHTLKMYQNIQNDILDQVSVESVIAVSSTNIPGSSEGGRRSSLFRKLPHVPQANDDFYWKSYGDGLVTENSNCQSNFYSISGLSEFYSDFQLLYTEFIDIRRKSLQVGDNTTISAATSFLEKLESFSARYMLNSPTRKDSTESVQTRRRTFVRTTDLDQVDKAMVSFHSLPEWVLPIDLVDESLTLMKDQVQNICDGSLITKFHNKLLAAINYHNIEASKKVEEKANSEHQETVVKIGIYTEAAMETAHAQLASAIFLPGLAAGRNLPPDTEELIERGKLVLKLRRAALHRVWLKEEALELHGSPRSSLAAQQFFTDKKPVTTNTPPSFEDGARKSSLSLAQKMKSKRQSLERSGKGVQKQQEADDEDDYFAQNFDNTLESVEEVIEDWFDSIPDPDLNAGSEEVNNLSCFVQNKLLGKYMKPIIYQDSPVLNHDDAPMRASMKSTVGSCTSGDLLPILEVAYRDRPFAKTNDNSNGLDKANIVFDVLLCEELDAWETARFLDNLSAPTDDSMPWVQYLLETAISEFRTRELLYAVQEDQRCVESMESGSEFNLNPASALHRLVGLINQDHSGNRLNKIQHFLLKEFAKENVKDKRLVLLHQFLEFQKSRRQNGISEGKVEHKTSDMMHVSDWISFTATDWDMLFHTKSPSRAFHPLVYLRSTVAGERRDTILNWHLAYFDSSCDAIGETGIHNPSEEKITERIDKTSLTAVGKYSEIYNKNLNENLKNILIHTFGKFYEQNRSFLGKTDTLRTRSSITESQILESSGLGMILNLNLKNRTVQNYWIIFDWLLCGLHHNDGSEWKSEFSTEEKVSVVLQSNIPIDLRHKIRECYMGAIIYTAESYVTEQLCKAAKGTLMENCSRRQIFVDIASAFGEMSVALEKIHRVESIYHSPNKQKSTSDIIDAANWILKLQMALLLEDWDAIDRVVAESSHHDSINSKYPLCIQAYCDLAMNIKAHTQLLSLIEESLCYDGTNAPIPDPNSKETDNKPYLYFINFPMLEKVLEKANDARLVTSEELKQRIQIAMFLIRLNTAIRQNKWFDESGLGLQRLKSTSSDDKFDSSDIQPVSYLLANDRPEYFPRHIAYEIQRIERQFQNQQVEVRLVNALINGQHYLETEDYSSIDTSELEDVIDIASSVRQQSHRTTLLFESAQKVLNLRRGIQMADWIGIRCWLGESIELAPEAVHEVSAITEMSNANMRMHEALESGMSQGQVGGSYMKLDTSHTNINGLLYALRLSVNAPKLSAEDKQIIYSAEKLKAVRISILMADYAKVVRETDSIELRGISSSALNELLLVKRAISFFETMKRISYCLRVGRASGRPGALDTQDLSLYQLNTALLSVESKSCSPSIKFFLENVEAIRSLRSAMKGGRWGTVEIAELMLQRVIKSGKRGQFEFKNHLASSATETYMLNHIGHQVRRLDYGREILGGEWHQSASKSKIRDSDGDEENNYNYDSTGNETWSGLSSLLHGDLQSDHHSVLMGDEVDPGYRDVLHRVMYFSTSLGSNAIDRDTVAYILGNYPQQVLQEVELEVLQIRDELYHRVIEHVLQRGFLKSTVSEDKIMQALPYEPTPIEHALQVAQHLGLKSIACWRLYHTAIVIRDLRFYQQNNDNAMVLTVLSKIKSLKSNDLFSTVAAPEVEEAFLQVCGNDIKKILTHALDCVLTRPNRVGSKEEARMELDEYEKTKILRNAMRHSNQIGNTSSYDGTIRILMTLCGCLLKLRSAIHSGIVSKIQSTYDDMVVQEATFQKEVKSIPELAWLTPRLWKELVIVRKKLFSMQYASASALTDSPAFFGAYVNSNSSLQYQDSSNMLDNVLSSDMEISKLIESVLNSYSAKHPGRHVENPSAANMNATLTSLFAAKYKPDSQIPISNNDSITIRITRKGDFQTKLEEIFDNTDLSYSILKRLGACTLLSLLHIEPASSFNELGDYFSPEKKNVIFAENNSNRNPLVENTRSISPIRANTKNSKKVKPAKYIESTIVPVSFEILRLSLPILSIQESKNGKQKHANMSSSHLLVKYGEFLEATLLYITNSTKHIHEREYPIYKLKYLEHCISILMKDCEKLNSKTDSVLQFGMEKVQDAQLKLLARNR